LELMLTLELMLECGLELVLAGSGVSLGADVGVGDGVGAEVGAGVGEEDGVGAVVGAGVGVGLGFEVGAGVWTADGVGAAVCGVGVDFGVCVGCSS
jgi:hypothetical protein